MLFDQYLAIDYGTKNIKGILFQNSLGTVTVLRTETLPIVKFQEEEGDEYEYNIIRFIQSFFPEETKFLVNISLDRLFIRDLVIPLTNEKAVREIIPFEVENKLPFPTESMEVLGVLSKIDSENTYVVTFSTEQKEIQRVMGPFQRGDAVIASLSVDSYALSSLLTKAYKDTKPEQDYLCQLDIGSESCIFNAIHQGKLYHTRSFHSGTQALTEMIAEELGLSTQDADEFKILFADCLLEETEVPPAKWEDYKKTYKLTTNQWKNLQKKIEKYIDKMIREIEKSIFSLLDTERPQGIYFSGGGSNLIGLPEKIANRLELPILRYNLPPEIPDLSFVQCYATGIHYNLKATEKIDYLETPFAKRLNRSSFKIGNLLPHAILGGISLIILLCVFVFGIVIDKRKISQNYQVLAEKYKNGFGEEPPEPESILSSAQSKLKAEQKKTEIFRLFLNKESVLDLMADATEHFPDKDNFAFMFEQFTYDGSEVVIYGRVNEFGEIGTIETALGKSDKFKNIKVLNKRLITGVSKFKVSFRLRMEVVSPGSD